MRDRILASIATLVGIALANALGSSPLAAQSPAPAKAKAPTAKAYTPPRTVDGQPDLQGVWANNVITPLERPKELAGREYLTDQEVAVLKQRASELFNGSGDAAFGDSVFTSVIQDAKTFVSRDGKTGDYNHFWLVDRDFDNRTSLVTTPDGKIPALTPEAQKRLAARRGRVGGGTRTETDENGAAGRADSWEDRSLSERCITFGVPRLGAGYNSYYQIIQSANYVAIYQETIHDVRIIPLDGRPHVSKDVTEMLGDSRGHFEGNTLVVDTTNFSPKSNFRGASDTLHIVERFTRVAPDTLKYELAVDDPSMWTGPWSVMIPLRHSNDQIYEYACHEGNTGLSGILAGAREEEKEAAASAAAAKKGSR